MKISTLEKAVLALTAAFVLLLTGYFLGARQAEPYRVDVQTPAASESSAPAPAPSPPPDGAPDEKLDINTATAEELEGLPGIGEKRAQDIIADREQNGPFRIPEDITRVKGIGEGTLAGLIDLITVE